MHECAGKRAGQSQRRPPWPPRPPPTHLPVVGREAPVLACRDFRVVGMRQRRSGTGQACSTSDQQGTWAWICGQPGLPCPPSTHLLARRHLAAPLWTCPCGRGGARPTCPRCACRRLQHARNTAGNSVSPAPPPAPVKGLRGAGMPPKAESPAPPPPASTYWQAAPPIPTTHHPTRTYWQVALEHHVPRARVVGDLHPRRRGRQGGRPAV